jgi:hypothetical protein
MTCLVAREARLSLTNIKTIAGMSCNGQPRRNGLRQFHQDLTDPNINPMKGVHFNLNDIAAWFQSISNRFIGNTITQARNVYPFGRPDRVKR